MILVPPAGWRAIGRARRHVRNLLGNDARGARRQGVDRIVAILFDQIVRTMKLLGARSLEELTP
jgi:isopentenyl diphosphate isomerase/L-lactate dehydrogenase-like FMN-dependent dehydrogenase